MSEELSHDHDEQSIHSDHNNVEEFAGVYPMMFYELSDESANAVNNSSNTSNEGNRCDLSSDLDVYYDHISIFPIGVSKVANDNKNGWRFTVSKVFPDGKQLYVSSNNRYFLEKARKCIICILVYRELHKNRDIEYPVAAVNCFRELVKNQKSRKPQWMEAIENVVNAISCNKNNGVDVSNRRNGLDSDVTSTAAFESRVGNSHSDNSEDLSFTSFKRRLNSLNCDQKRDIYELMYEYYLDMQAGSANGDGGMKGVPLTPVEISKLYKLLNNECKKLLFTDMVDVMQNDSGSGVVSPISEPSPYSGHEDINTQISNSSTMGLDDMLSEPSANSDMYSIASSDMTMQYPVAAATALEVRNPPSVPVVSSSALWEDFDELLDYAPAPAKRARVDEDLDGFDLNFSFLSVTPAKLDHGVISDDADSATTAVAVTVDRSNPVTAENEAELFLTIANKLVNILSIPLPDVTADKDIAKQHRLEAYYELLQQSSQCWLPKPVVSVERKFVFDVVNPHKWLNLMYDVSKPPVGDVSDEDMSSYVIALFHLVYGNANEYWNVSRPAVDLTWDKDSLFIDLGKNKNRIYMRGLSFFGVIACYLLKVIVPIVLELKNQKNASTSSATPAATAAKPSKYSRIVTGVRVLDGMVLFLRDINYISDALLLCGLSRQLKEVWCKDAKGVVIGRAHELEGALWRLQGSPDKALEHLNIAHDMYLGTFSTLKDDEIHSNRDFLSINYQKGKAYLELGRIDGGPGCCKNGAHYIPSDNFFHALKYFNRARISWKIASKNINFNKNPVLFDFDPKCVRNLIFGHILWSYTFGKRDSTNRVINFLTGNKIDPVASASNFLLDVVSLECKGENKFNKLKDIKSLFAYESCKACLNDQSTDLGIIFDKMMRCEDEGEVM